MLELLNKTLIMKLSIIQFFLTFSFFACTLTNKIGSNVYRVESKKYQFELNEINEKFALFYQDNDIGGPRIYKYSINEGGDNVNYTINDPESRSVIISSSIEKESEDSLRLYFFEIVEETPLSIFEIYINDEKYSTTDVGVFKIKKSDIPNIDGKYHVQILYGGTFDIILDKENKDYLIHFHQNHLLQDSNLKEIVATKDDLFLINGNKVKVKKIPSSLSNINIR